MKSTMEMVIEFHDAFKIDLEKRQGTSHKFMDEELQEFKDAENDVERLDELCDLQYFLDGSFHAYGWDKIKDLAMAEVHRSNMSKLGPDGKPIFREDGKIVKGPNFFKPNLEQFFYIEYPKFQIGDRVFKVKGSQWQGRVVGTYSTEQTPEGYAVESETHKGSVQIYPAAALEKV